MNIKKLIGNKAFYRMILGITIPIIIQNGITNFVNLLDNVMVGRLGTEQLSGVGISNQLIFVFTLCVFGGLSGAGIFTAQFFGKGDREGLRDSVRFKFYTILLILAAGAAVLIPFGEDLITLFLTEEDSTGDVAMTLYYGREYLHVALISLVPMALTQIYANTLRETGHTVPPMVASIAAVVTNALCNWLLIFGIGPFPALGVVGAAWGTVIARVLELAVVVIWSHANPGKATFVTGLFSSLRIPLGLVKQIALKTLPLMANEFLWSLGMTVLNQCYSTRGLAAVAAVNIAITIANVFNIVFLSMGTAVAIVVGNQLGAGQIEEAKDTDRKIIAFSCVLCVAIGVIMAAMSPLFTVFYNVTEDVKALAAIMIVVYAAMMPFSSFAHNCYFTLRSGGQTFITFLFDSAFVWAISVPVGLILSRLTDLPIIPLFVICASLELFKCIIGFFMLKSGKWAKKLV